VGDKPHGVALKSNGRRAYVGNHGDNSLSLVNANTFNLITTKAVGNGPNGAAYNPNNNRVYVANRNSNTVSAMRLSDYHIKTINVGSLPNGVAVNTDTNRIYVANFNDGTVSEIRGSDNTVVDTIDVGAGSQPSMIAVNPVTNKAYVSLHGSGRVAVIHGSGSVHSVDVFSQGPYGIAVDTHRNLVYVATIDTFRIAVIDGTDDGSEDSFEGWVEIRRLNSGDPVPLRMIAVNPHIGTSGHIFATTAGTDGGADKFLMFPKGWPEGFARPYALDLDEPREGIAFDPNTYRVHVTSRSDDLLAIYQDGEPTCPANLESLDEFQLKVCIAAKDGSCSEVFFR
jgi:YVTN family beta-propeller protein